MKKDKKDDERYEDEYIKEPENDLEEENSVPKKGKAPVIILTVLLIVVVAAIVFLVLRPDDSTNTSSAKESSKAFSEDISVIDLTEEEATPTPTNTPTPKPTATATPTATPKPTGDVTTVSGDELSSGFAYMFRMSDGKVLIDKNSGEMTYPASITKLMTAMVVVANVGDLSQTVTVTEEDINAATEAGASVAGFVAGENVSYIDLLYGLLLPSGSDACNALTRSVAGSEEAFVELMNQKAAELGCNNTHFANASGLHDEMHFSTCKDLSVIFTTFLSNQTLHDIICTDTHICTPTDAHQSGLAFSNTMFDALTSGNILPNGAAINGGKTGTTDQAGRCLASFATWNNADYMLITTYAPFAEDGTNLNIEDAYAAYGGLKNQ